MERGGYEADDKLMSTVRGETPLPTSGVHCFEVSSHANCFEVVLQKSIPTHIRKLILYISNNRGHVDGFVRLQNDVTDNLCEKRLLLLYLMSTVRGEIPLPTSGVHFFEVAPSPERCILLPNNQRRCVTLCTQNDVRPYALC